MGEEITHVIFDIMLSYQKAPCYWVLSGHSWEAALPDHMCVYTHLCLIDETLTMDFEIAPVM